jgi:AcrR family transcriptional regulator
MKPEIHGRGAARAPGRPAGEAAAGLRSAILDAAETLFAERGFAATPVRDIAERAGANPAMVHYYFGSKRALLEQVLERSLEPLAAAFAQMRAGGAAPVGDIARLMLETLGAHPNLAVLMVREVMLPGGVMRERFLERMAPRLGGTLPDLLAAEQAAGRVNAGLDPRISALLLLALAVFPFIGRGVAEPGIGVAYDGAGLERLERHVATVLEGGFSP